MSYISKIIEKKRQHKICVNDNVLTIEQAYLYKNKIDELEENLMKSINKNKTNDVRFYIYKYLIIMLIGSLLGSFWESFYHLICTGVLETRHGVIYGPFKPLYGYGAMLLAFSLRNIKKWYNIFTYGAILGGGFEYLISLFQEEVLGTQSWDYSSYPTNIDGRTTIIYCVAWGILSLLLMLVIYPFSHRWATKVYRKGSGIFTKIVILSMLVLTFFTYTVMIRQTFRNLGYEPLTFIGKFYDLVYPDEKLAKIFPNMNLDF